MTLRTVLCDGKKSVSVYYTDDEYCFPRYGFATDAYASDSSGSLRDSWRVKEKEKHMKKVQR